MRKLILLLLVVTGARPECPGGASAPQPPFPLPYIQRNLCPTECCVYRTWTPRGDLIVHRAPSMASPFSFRIPAARQFLAVTGEVITLEPGIAVVRKGAGVYTKGDTLWVLSPEAKRGFTVWHRGKLRAVHLVQNPEGAPAEESGLRAVQSTPQVSEWWVRVRYAGSSGWIRVDPENPRIDGLDNCR